MPLCRIMYVIRHWHEPGQFQREELCGIYNAVSRFPKMLFDKTSNYRKFPRKVGGARGKKARINTFDYRTRILRRI